MIPLAASPVEASVASPAPYFDEIYQAHFGFVWRSVRSLGVPQAALDDATQEIFVVVHQRLATFEGRATFRTWLYGIVRNVVRNYRRSERRHLHSNDADGEVDPDTLGDANEPSPEDAAAAAQAVRQVTRILDALDDEQREVFVLAELEQIPVKQIAEMLQENVNTVYSRLRLARSAFALATQRHRLRDTWRAG